MCVCPLQYLPYPCVNPSHSFDELPQSFPMFCHSSTCMTYRWCTIVINFSSVGLTYTCIMPHAIAYKCTRQHESNARQCQQLGASILGPPLLFNTLLLVCCCQSELNNMWMGDLSWWAGFFWVHIRCSKSFKLLSAPITLFQTFIADFNLMWQMYIHDVLKLIGPDLFISSMDNGYGCTMFVIWERSQLFLPLLMLITVTYLLHQVWLTN